MRDRKRASLPSKQAKPSKTRASVLRALVTPLFDGQKTDKAQQFIWGGLSEMCLYAGRRMPEISDHIVDVDRAMRWGFAWELGPFEIVDALGLPAFAEQIKKEGRALPAVFEKALASGRKSFYESEKGVTSVFDLATASAKKVEEPAGILILKNLKDAGREVERNSGASLIDLGDGVVCCEFHAKMNAIGADLIAMLHKGLKRLEKDFDAMVIANQATNFSVGANLMLVLGWSAGAGVGRTAHGREAIPERESGHQVRAQAGRGRSTRHGAGRRLRNQFARREDSSGRGGVHRPGGSGCRPDSGRRRHEGDAHPRE